MTNSIASGKPLEPLFSLGELDISDFLKPGEKPRGAKYPLSLGIDKESGLVQLTCQPPAELMWGETYWYKSGTNQFMKDALKDVVEKTKGFVRPKGDEDIWVDIAGNDGTLLSFVGADYAKVNIDPSAYPESQEICNVTIRDYFSAEVYQKVFKDSKARVVTCCAMFYDLQEPVKFISDVHEVLEDDGVFVLQLSYTPLMLIQGELGNVCHEHIAYYTLQSLEYVLGRGGFKVVDVELNNVNGGSIRVYAMKSSSPAKFKTQADRDVARIRVQSLRDFERSGLYNTAEKYKQFYFDMIYQRNEFLTFLFNEKAKGKRFWGYGASTKGNTILQWYGLGPNEIEKIAERQGRKVGLVCAGSNIPVCSEEEAREAIPDYMIVFPWHFIGEFKERERDYLKAGGKFVVLSPKFEVIGYED